MSAGVTSAMALVSRARAVLVGVDDALDVGEVDTEELASGGVWQRPPCPSYGGEQLQGIVYVNVGCAPFLLK